MRVLPSSRSRGPSWWSVGASVATTVAVFAVALEAMRAPRRTTWGSSPPAERTALVSLSLPDRPAPPPAARPERTVRRASAVGPSRARRAIPSPEPEAVSVDTTAAPVAAPQPAMPVPEVAPPAVDGGGMTPAVAPPAPRAGLASTSVHFLGFGLLDSAARDSMVAAVERGRAGIARERARDVLASVVQEEWRRWAAVRASSDRLRPAPAVGQVWDRPGSSFGATGGVSVPLFSRGPSRAQRQRDSVVHAENLARLRRIDARMRARRDSLVATP